MLKGLRFGERIFDGDGQENVYLNSKIDIYREWNNFKTILISQSIYFSFQNYCTPNTLKPAFSKSILP